MRLWPTGGLWRHRDFLRLWAAQIVSAFGSRITRTALPVIAVVSLSGSPTEVAILAALTTGPGVLVGLAAGGRVDRAHKRSILIGADLVRAAAVAPLPAAAWADALTVPHVYAVAIVVGAATALFEITYVAYLPALVSTRHVLEGNQKLQSTEAIAEITGPGAGGVLIAILGAPLAVLLDAATYLWSALFLGTIRRREVPAAPPEEAPSWRRDVAIGARAAFGHPLVRPLFIAGGIGMFFMGFFAALYMLYALDELALGTGTIGVVIGFGGVGALAGAALSHAILRWLGLGPGMIAALFITQIASFCIPLAGSSLVPGGATVPLLIAHQLVGDGMMMAFLIPSVSLRQTVLPRALLGRVDATLHIIVGALLPLGALTAGPLAEALGLRTTLVIGEIGGLLAPLVLLASPLRRVRAMPPSPDGDHDDAPDAPDAPDALDV
jgi:hypothetical protein